MIGFELGLKINFHGGGWPEQMRIRLTSASTGVRVEVGAELGTMGNQNLRESFGLGRQAVTTNNESKNYDNR